MPVHWNTRESTVTTQPVVSVIDDNASVRKALKRLIGSAGFDVSTFASAQDFLDRRPASGCIILDVTMPGMDGLELQDHLNATGSTEPIVFITAYDDESARTRAIDAGAAGFLEKPFDDVELLDAIQKALEGQG